MTLDFLNKRYGRAECWHDHDILRSKILDVGAPGLIEQIPDPEGGDLCIHLGIVDDLADQEETGLGKDFPSSVGQINRPLDTVTKAKLLGQTEGSLCNLQD